MDNILAENYKTILDDFNPSALAAKLSGRMRKLRLAKNITQETLSGMSGVSLGSLKRFENKNEISLKHLLQIALSLDALDAFQNLFPEDSYQSIDDLLEGQKTKERKRASNV